MLSCFCHGGYLASTQGQQLQEEPPRTTAVRTAVESDADEDKALGGRSNKGVAQWTM